MLELEKNKILPVLISYTVPYADMLVDTDGWDWIKLALRSFHAHFPQEKVLVVDNDSDDDQYAKTCVAACVFRRDRHQKPTDSRCRVLAEPSPPS